LRKRGFDRELVKEARMGASVAPALKASTGDSLLLEEVT
jgi:hypothetical protein